MKLLALAVVLAIVPACGSSSRAQARGATLVTAQAVKISDAACARISLDLGDVKLARACEAAYDAARKSLDEAALFVDNWDDGKRREVACNVAHAAVELRRIESELGSRKVSLPPVVVDALKLADELGGCS